MSHPSTHTALNALVFSAFSASAAYSLYHLLAASLVGTRRSTSRAAPAVPQATVLHVLQHVHEAVRGRAEDLHRALELFRESGLHGARRLPAAAAAAEVELARLEQEARAEVQEAVAVAQAEALAACDPPLPLAKFEHAAAYFSEGPGRSAEVLAACARLRRCAGRFFVTRAGILRSVVGLLQGSNEAAVTVIWDKLQHDYAAGLLLRPSTQSLLARVVRVLPSRPPMLEAMLGALHKSVAQDVDDLVKMPAYSKLSMEAVDNFMRDETGMAANELLQFADEHCSHDPEVLQKLHEGKALGKQVMEEELKRFIDEVMRDSLENGASGEGGAEPSTPFVGGMGGYGYSGGGGDPLAMGSDGGGTPRVFRSRFRAGASGVGL